MIEDGTQPTEHANWGRWGSADEIGALNLLTPEITLEATRLVRTGRRYGLAITLDPRRLPVSPTRSTVGAHFMTIDGGDYAAGVRLPHDMRVADDYVVMPTHWGTHIDALAHVWREDELYNGHPSTTVRSYGATRCGIDKVGVIATRGLLLDIPSALGLPRLEPGYVITPEDIKATLPPGGVRPGDAVLIRTGLIQIAAEAPEQFYRDPHPGLGLEAAIELAQNDVVLIGADNAAVEPARWEHGRMANGPIVHECLLRDFGVHLMEFVNLEELARDNVHEFLLVVAPLPFKGGVGSPVNPVALC